MKQRAFVALLFAGLAVWFAFSHPWAAPGFTLLAASNLTLPIAVWRGVDRGRAAFAALVTSLGLLWLGLAYLLALFGGMPTTAGFWAVFGAAVSVAAPVVLLFRRITLGRTVS